MAAQDASRRAELEEERKKSEARVAELEARMALEREAAMKEAAEKVGLPCVCGGGGELYMRLTVRAFLNGKRRLCKMDPPIVSPTPSLPLPLAATRSRGEDERHGWQ